MPQSDPHGLTRPHPRFAPFLVVMLLLALSLALAACNSGAGPTTGDSAEDTTAGPFADIPTEGPFLGQADAPVLIRDFSDFSCPHCADAARELIPQIVEEYVRSGQVRIEMVPVSIAGGTPSAYAAMGALCAGDQNQLWTYQEKLFEVQGLRRFEPSTLSDLASGINLDLSQFQNCVASTKYLRQVQANDEEFRRVGGEGTPTFLVGNSLVRGAVPYADMKAAIDTQLEAAK